MFKTVKIERHAWGNALILNRPEKLNALSRTLVQEFHDALLQLELEKPKLLLIKGEGKSFCSGHDTSSMIPDNELTKEIKKLQQITTSIVKFPAPVVASVSGYALGAGFEIALNCDLIYLSEDAIIGLPEIKKGLSVTQGSTFFLPRLIGLQKAKELLFFGEEISSRQALDLGLVNDVFPSSKIDHFVYERLETLSKHSLQSLTAMKRLLNNGVQSSLSDCINLESNELKTIMSKV